MPHRSPLVAALERCGQLRARIVEADPTRTVTIGRVRTLDDALRELERLEKLLGSLDRAGAIRDEDDDDFVAVGRDGDEHGTSAPVPRGALGRSSPVATAATALVVLIAGGGLYLLEHGGSSLRTSSVPYPAMESIISFDGTVARASGALSEDLGARCSVTIADSGPRKGGRKCVIDVTCPHERVAIDAEGCPIGEEANGVFAFAVDGFKMDSRTGIVTFSNASASAMLHFDHR
jgi:hypothetical protein